MRRSTVVRVSVAVLALLLLGLAAAQVSAEDGRRTKERPAAATHQEFHRPTTTPEQRRQWETMEVKQILDAGRRPQVVIGTDEREQISDTTAYPYRAIAQLEMYDANFEDGTIGICTATFIGPNVLLTAAHCLYSDADFGGWIDDVAVIPGRDGGYEPYGFEWIAEAWVPSEYISDDYVGTPYDYAIITLSSSALGDTVGSLQIGVLTTASLEAGDFDVVTSGYPGDMDFGTQWMSSEPSFTLVTNTHLEHEIDSMQGQSGSAVWRGGDLSIVGVESYEVFGGYEINAAVRITQSVLDDLLGACGSLGCDFDYWVEGDQPGPEPTETTTVTPTETVTASPTATATNPGPAPNPNQPSANPSDNGAFARTWQRTDKPVADGQVSRTWMWGEQPLTSMLWEPYSDSPGTYRTVQYFDKSRMEITQPGSDQSSPWYVSNGLLVVELMSGRLQLGNDLFEQYQPAMVNVAGDGDDPSGPTYQTLSLLTDLPAYGDGQPITSRVNREGVVTDDPGLAGYGVTAAHLVDVPGIRHQVASPFWAFMNADGVVYDNGGFTTAPLFLNPFYATGYPVTEAYWANVKVGGEYKDVLLQCFERRCLTYTPSNSPGWQVEAGNVGWHYYQWRYELNDLPQPDQVPNEGDIIGAADFSTWSTGPNSIGETSYVDGEYRVRVDETEGAFYAQFATGVTMTDGGLSLDVKLLTDSQYGEACLTARADPSYNYDWGYALCLSGDGALYAVYEGFDESGAYFSTTLLDLTTNGATRPTNEWNTLKIIAQGDRFWFFINGVLLGSAANGEHLSGALGFYVANFDAGPVEWAFRNLELREIN
jgi:V8-like Glu-specific endopeptidase